MINETVYKRMKKLGPVCWLTALRRTDLVAKELKVLRRGMVVAVCVRFCHRGRPCSIPWNSLWNLLWTEWLTMDRVFSECSGFPVSYLSTSVFRSYLLPSINLSTSVFRSYLLPSIICTYRPYTWCGRKVMKLATLCTNRQRCCLPLHMEVRLTPAVDSAQV